MEGPVDSYPTRCYWNGKKPLHPVRIACRITEGSGPSRSGALDASWTRDLRPRALAAHAPAPVVRDHASKPRQLLDRVTPDERGTADAMNAGDRRSLAAHVVVKPDPVDAGLRQTATLPRPRGHADRLRGTGRAATPCPTARFRLGPGISTAATAEACKGQLRSLVAGRAQTTVAADETAAGGCQVGPFRVVGSGRPATLRRGPPHRGASDSATASVAEY